MFGSLTDEEIAAAGKTYQDVTALRDPLMGNPRSNESFSLRATSC